MLHTTRKVHTDRVLFIESLQLNASQATDSAPLGSFRFTSPSTQYSFSHHELAGAERRGGDGSRCCGGMRCGWRGGERAPQHSRRGKNGRVVKVNVL